MGAGLLNLLDGYQKLDRLLKNYHQSKEGEVIGLDDSSRNLFLANLYHKINNNLLIITTGDQNADNIYEDLLRLLGEDKVVLFSKIEVLPHESLEIEENIKVERLKVLKMLSFEKEMIIVTPIEALLETIIPLDEYKKYKITINVGDELVLDDFSARLVKMGHKRVAQVEKKGHFSIRGGIIDLYPVAFKPIRIDLFGDEIESIRQFDIATQRSVKELKKLEIGPASEFIIPQDKVDSALDKIESDFKKEVEGLSQAKASKLKEKIDYDLEQIREGIDFSNSREYLSYFYSQATLLDYFKGDLVFDDLERIKERAINFLTNINDSYSSLVQKGEVLKSYRRLFIDFDDLFYGIKHYKFYLSPTKKKNDLLFDFNVDISGRKVEAFQGNIKLFLKHLKRYFKEGYKVVIGLSKLTKAKRLQKRLKDANLPAIVVAKITDQIKKGNIILTTINLETGFLIPELKFILYTENELFKDLKRKRRRSKAFNQGVEIASFTDLKEGDYVVHENHGIGKYLGVETLEVQGRSKDYLLILYSDDGQLYVPTDKVDLIQKYVGLDDKKPRLHKLDGDNWRKAKARVKKSVEEMAEELLDLYAKRELETGYSFSEDMVWQNEFEANFPYQETKDQLKAIEDVKVDMESKQPMDRLLCGDVGYGKTEVAIRAIFKAIMDGKQAGFLVPTTILAQQHWNNISDRFSDYPINVAMLSRFRTPAQQKKIIKGIQRGNVDLVIGTHRLLSKDIKFNDLGIVVVDEEQRFGVKQKEKLKRLKESVDVLTMSATPIPRTLHMSLVGVRDISLIETPPENRYPIRTYVGEFNQNLVKEALAKEINRGGQAYFVHNRVKDIKKVAGKIASLLPQARIAVAHGQMSETRLEELMIDFLEGRYDILVCTTIIETGMDISNVNTIIIDQADKMGLSQLYQLRGRVGRTNRIAYAYLLYQGDRILSEVAEKRLKAIKEFVSLGSGFKIAMRDLEIRGAGNILGPQQHGHIEAIGFSLYCKLLEEAVERLKNGEVEKEENVILELKTDAYLPQDYIPNAGLKIEVYKKIQKISDLEHYQDLREEIEDRFGDLPKVVDNLLELAKIKVLGSKLCLLEIKERKAKLEFKFSMAHFLSGERLVQLASEFSNLKFVVGKEPKIEVKVASLYDGEKIELILKILEFLLTTQV